MTLNDIVLLLDTEQYVYIWFSDDIIGRGSISTLLKRKEIRALLDCKVIKTYIDNNNRLHRHTDFKSSRTH